MAPGRYAIAQHSADRDFLGFSVQPTRSERSTGALQNRPTRSWEGNCKGRRWRPIGGCGAPAHHRRTRSYALPARARAVLRPARQSHRRYGLWPTAREGAHTASVNYAIAHAPSGESPNRQWTIGTPHRRHQRSANRSSTDVERRSAPTGSLRSRPGRGLHCLNTETQSVTVLRQFDPVAALRLIEIGSVDDALQNAAVLLDRSDRSDVVVVARHQNVPSTTLLASDVQRLAENLGGIATSSKLGHHHVADVRRDDGEIH